MMKYTIRSADTDDIDFIYSLTSHYSAKRLMLARNRDEIRKLLDTFLIAVKESMPVGIISYHDYGPGLKEIRSLAVSEENARSGIGSLLLQDMIKKINTLSKARIFALTYSPDFFRKNGFVEVSRESLPEKIWKDCQNCPDRDNCTETALVYSPE